jgi:hypothetical protein
MTWFYVPPKISRHRSPEYTQLTACASILSEKLLGFRFQPVRPYTFYRIENFHRKLVKVTSITLLDSSEMLAYRISPAMIS